MSRRRTARSFSVTELALQDQASANRRFSENDLFSAADLFDNMSSANSPLIRPEPTHVTKPSYDPALFSKYVTENQSLRASSIVSAIKELSEFGRGLNRSILILSNARNDAQKSLEHISRFIIENSMFEPNYLRNVMKKDIGIREDIIAYTSAEINKTRKIITVIEQFVNYIQTFQNYYLVFTQKFLADFFTPSTPDPKIEKVMEHIPLVVFPDLQKAPKKPIYYIKDSKEKRLLERVKEKFRELKPDDSAYLIETSQRAQITLRRPKKFFSKNAGKSKIIRGCQARYTFFLICQTSYQKFLVPRSFQTNTNT